MTLWGGVYSNQQKGITYAKICWIISSFCMRSPALKCHLSHKLLSLVLRVIVLLNLKGGLIFLSLNDLRYISWSESASFWWLSWAIINSQWSPKVPEVSLSMIPFGTSATTCATTLLHPYHNQQKRERANKGMPLPPEDVSWTWQAVFLLLSYWLELDLVTTSKYKEGWKMSYTIRAQATVPTLLPNLLAWIALFTNTHLPTLTHQIFVSPCFVLELVPLTRHAKVGKGPHWGIPI